MLFNELPDFSKELKRFLRKYRTLIMDLEEFKRVVTIFPLGNSKHFNVITKNEVCSIIKARLFCRALKGSSLRIIYAAYHQSHKIEFIELYFKGEKENEDHGRIKKYLKT
jgi:hypothetical protein